MNKLIYFLIIGLLINCGTSKDLAKNKYLITKVTFPNNSSKIILNDKHAFNYKKIGNNFEILSLKNKKLISGAITKINGKWSSIIQFHTVNKSFSNPKIIGRNDLIFSLADFNVITEKFNLNKSRLLEFINKKNTL